VNGTLAYRFARRRGQVYCVDFERESEAVQTLPELLVLMGQRLPWRLLIAGVAGILAILVAAGEVSNWDVFLRFVYQVPYGRSDPQYGKDIGFYLFSRPPISSSKIGFCCCSSSAFSSPERCIGCKATSNSTSSAGRSHPRPSLMAPLCWGSSSR